MKWQAPPFLIKRNRSISAEHHGQAFAQSQGYNHEIAILERELPTNKEAELRELLTLSTQPPLTEMKFDTRNPIPKQVKIPRVRAPLRFPILPSRSCKVVRARFV
ncbi:hypothetical protein ACTXT7_017454 [Hymenolepis weldensis]